MAGIRTSTDVSSYGPHWNRASRRAPPGVNAVTEASKPNPAGLGLLMALPRDRRIVESVRQGLRGPHGARVAQSGLVVALASRWPR